MGRIIFIAVIWLFCTLFSTYTGWRLITPAKVPFPLKMMAWVAVVVLWLSFPLPILLRRMEFNHPGVDTLSYVIYTGIGFMSLVLVLLFIRDAVWIVGILTQKLVSFVGILFPSDTGTKKIFDAGRREFVINSVNGGILAVSGPKVQNTN